MIHVEHGATGSKIFLKLFLCAAACLTGCATPQTAPAVTKVPVAEAPCKAGLKARPAYPADTLTGNEGIWALGVALWADRKARQARELELETALEGCTKPAP